MTVDILTWRKFIANFTKFLSLPEEVIRIKCGPLSPSSVAAARGS